MKEFSFSLGSTETGALELGIGVHAETEAEALEKLKEGFDEEEGGIHLGLRHIHADFAWGELRFNTAEISLANIVCMNEVE